MSFVYNSSMSWMNELEKLVPSTWSSDQATDCYMVNLVIDTEELCERHGFDHCFTETQIELPYTDDTYQKATQILKQIDPDTCDYRQSLRIQHYTR